MSKAKTRVREDPVVRRAQIVDEADFPTRGCSTILNLKTGCYLPCLTRSSVGKWMRYRR
jgi:hypothetical protein